MTTSPKASRATRPAPTSAHVSPADDFQRGYHIGAQAARMEQRHGIGATTASEMFFFIGTRLDPAHIERQRDAARNPLPPAYHAGLVAGYLVTLFASDPAQENRRGGHTDD